MPNFQEIEHAVHTAPRDALILVPRDLLMAIFQRHADMELQLTEFILYALTREEVCSCTTGHGCCSESDLA